MVKESRVLQWYIDSYSSPTDFKNLNEEQKAELMADTIYYMSSFILMLRNKVGYLEDRLNHSMVTKSTLILHSNGSTLNI